MKAPLIAGNWKMNLTVAESLELVSMLHHGIKRAGDLDVVVAPNSVSLGIVANYLKESFISVAAQNMHWEDQGAFTGEVSARFLKDAYIDYVILGHSERRQYFCETDENVNKKTKSALANHLTPIVCVGETLQERESGQVAQVIEKQILGATKDLTNEQIAKLVVAYEPVWAIGTGKTATPEQAEEVHAMIRLKLAHISNATVADQIRILYGGSVKSSNSKELLKLPNVDGALVGGASLNYIDFIGIIDSLF